MPHLDDDKREVEVAEETPEVLPVARMTSSFRGQ
jgi:hypothetical protein